MNLPQRLEPAYALASRWIVQLRTRNFGMFLVWVLFISAVGGTYILSKNIEARGENSAGVFMGTGNRHEIFLYKDQAEPALVRVQKGDEVVFSIQDTSHHNIAENRNQRKDARLESGEFSGEESYSLVFQTRGTMSFYDRMNQDIQVDVIIE